METRANKRVRSEMSAQVILRSSHNNDSSVNANEIRKVKRRVKKNMTLKEKIRSEAPANEFVNNEIVLATIPGFCPWPARIIQIDGETIMVEFFGTGQMCVSQRIFM